MRACFHLRRVLTPLSLAAALAAGKASAQVTPDYELPPIEYSKATPSNRIDQVARRLNETPLAERPTTPRATLQWILKELDVPEQTQVLVFSKTSLQRERIDPDHPRALFFSEDAYVGWVPGGLIEVAVSDPKLGLVFYHFDPSRRDPHIAFQRDAACLNCHGAGMTRDWPGLLVRSVFPDSDGNPIQSAGGFFVDHTTPLADRWGGYYVTGQHGSLRHMGNVTAVEKSSGVQMMRDKGANLNDLSKLVDLSGYVRKDSDIVALLVLEHQTAMHNRLSTGALRVRKWTHYQRELQRELGEKISDEPVGTALRVVQSEASNIAESLLFAGEAKFPTGGIRGSGDFQKAFLTGRRTDAAGRSLRDLDLTSRLFRYRCSFMVYSQAFDFLPPELKREVCRQLRQILEADWPPEKFRYISNEERKAIREILAVTKPEILKG